MKRDFNPQSYGLAKADVEFAPLPTMQRSGMCVWSDNIFTNPKRDAIGWAYTGTVHGLIGSAGVRAFSASRVYLAVDKLRDQIDIDPKRRSGVPVIKGTRFTVSQLFAQLAEGDSIDDIADDLQLNRDMLHDLLHAFSVVIDRPRIHEHRTT